MPCRSRLSVHAYANRGFYTEFPGFGASRAGFVSRRRTILTRLIIGDGPPPCPFEVVVLAALERPQKSHQSGQAEHQRQRNQEYEDFHQLSSRTPRCARSAFSSTSMDQPDIPAAPTSGVARP